MVGREVCMDDVGKIIEEMSGNLSLSAVMVVLVDGRDEEDSGVSNDDVKIEDEDGEDDNEEVDVVLMMLGGSGKQKTCIYKS